MSLNISASTLKFHEALLAYQTMIHPAMKWYPLCAPTFTIQQCQQIDRSYLPTLSTRMALNKMTKCLVLFFGPPNLGRGIWLCRHLVHSRLSNCTTTNAIGPYAPQ